MINSYEKGLRVIAYYDGGLPLNMIASVMNMSLHKVIEIVFWFKVTSRKEKTC